MDLRRRQVLTLGWHEHRAARYLDKASRGFKRYRIGNHLGPKLMAQHAIDRPRRIEMRPVEDVGEHTAIG